MAFNALVLVFICSLVFLTLGAASLIPDRVIVAMAKPIIDLMRRM